jgi:hypothetical protein
MEKGEYSDTNKTEQLPPSLREEMSKLLESMDPQGLLNIGDQEETTHPDGVDHTKSGDVHTAEHDVSLADNGSDHGSDAGSGSRQDGSRPDGSGHDGSGDNRIGKDSEEMEVSPPNFRIVDILPPTSLMMIQPLQPVGVATDPNPAPTQLAGTGTDGTAAAAEKPASPEKHIFAIPSNVAGYKNYHTLLTPVQGKNIFENPSAGNGSEQNPAKHCKPSTENSRNPSTGGNEIPTGVKAPTKNVSLPPKRSHPVEPDAVPSKTGGGPLQMLLTLTLNFLPASPKNSATGPTFGPF